MKNLKIIPDMVNKSISRNFTQVPDDFLQDPDISLKAKGIFACLLSFNKEKWIDYMRTLRGQMKEKETALKSGLLELEQHGYLSKGRYQESVQFYNKSINQGEEK